MEENNYEISVKKWGWTTMSFSKFVKKYFRIEQRIAIISNPKKCSVSHIFENRELTLDESLELFANYDYFLCEKNYYDLEQYLQCYQKVDIDIVNKARKELEDLLLNESSTKGILSNYLNNFPKGLYHEQVRKILEEK